MTRIIVDDKIPYIKGQIEQLADEVLYLSGAAITATDVREADILVVRTRTHCDRALLEGSRVRFIVTATIGVDHLDTAYLREAGIAWTNCPGCNATSVGQYVRNALCLLSREYGLDLRKATLGIVGVGHVGKAVLEACRPWVGRILLNDPPLALALDKGCAGEGTGLQAKDFSPLSQLQQECDILTFHTPLVREGAWPTFHLADETFLSHLPHRPFLLNAARGEVVDNEALERALDQGWVRQAVVDTWEHEPEPSPSLLRKVFIGTPHVAGYSADGKANATRMSLQAIARWMGREDKMHFHVEPPSMHIPCPADDPVDRALQLYDPRQDSQRLKASPDRFEWLRGNYPLRREADND